MSEHRSSRVPMNFPFSAVVGMDGVKLALVLCAIDPRIGGVLLRGQKGSAKTTLARGLAALLPGAAPFAELPVGATEDRLIGTLDLGAALAGEGRRFEPGLLAAAHGGVLYVDEVNLLPDHLVDVLLDVVASGVNRVERESISHEHPARFVLIGSMNPEEGELRPQLLDRFGLAADVRSSTDAQSRAEAVARRLAFDADPPVFAERWATGEAELRGRLASAAPGSVPDALLSRISALCASVGAEGLRADLVTARAAAALAGWEGRAEATDDDVRRVAELALAHRRRRSPFEAPELGHEELQQALDEALGEGEEAPGPSPDDRLAAPDPPAPVVRLAPTQTAHGAEAGRRSMTEGRRGRLVGDRVPSGPVGSVAVGATARNAAVRRVEAPDEPSVVRTDIREAVREQRAGNSIVLAVDASGSMGADARMSAVKGALLGLLLDAYQRRDRVALVTFRDEDAQVVLRPTSSVEVARARLAELPTGGRTPLAAGIEAALRLATEPSAGAREPLLVFVSDGRATSGPNGTDPFEAAVTAADAVRRRGISAVVVDAEVGPTRLGLAARIASAMGARHLTLDALSAGALEHALRGVLS
jgi:magnesium chelatase subunit D